MAPRYALYCLHAAQALDLLDVDESGTVNTTQLGQILIRSPLGSENERDILRQAFERSPGLTTLASLVLAETPPSVELVAERLMGLGPLSLSTALRRARTLLSWRRYLLPAEDGAQLPIRFGPASSSQAVVPISAPPVMAKADREESTQHGSAPEHAHALPDKVEPPPPTDEANGETAAVGFSEASRTVAVAEEEAVGISTADLAYLRRHIELGTVVLFTGAGFSLAARDGRGQPLPSGAAYARELWDICYPGEPFDNSSLQDIFEHAHRRHPKELQRSLELRFTVDTGSLPEWYRDWFSFPWSRIYTVNVDDLELAAERRFGRPRPLVPISALSQIHEVDGRSLQVIHLNGLASDGPDKVTFSVDQYSERIARLSSPPAPGSCIVSPA